LAAFFPADVSAALFLLRTIAVRSLLLSRAMNCRCQRRIRCALLEHLGDIGKLFCKN